MIYFDFFFFGFKFGFSFEIKLTPYKLGIFFYITSKIVWTKLKYAWKGLIVSRKLPSVSLVFFSIQFICIDWLKWYETISSFSAKSESDSIFFSAVRDNTNSLAVYDSFLLISALSYLLNHFFYFCSWLIWDIQKIQRNVFNFLYCVVISII